MATAAYPGLAEAAAVGNETDYRHTLARTTRMVLLLSWLGAAALVAVARPAASLLAVLMPAGGVDSVDRLAAGIAGFAPGLVGYGLFAVLSRALYARGRAQRCRSPRCWGGARRRWRCWGCPLPCPMTTGCWR